MSWLKLKSLTAQVKISFFKMPTLITKKSPKTLKIKTKKRLPKKFMIGVLSAAPSMAVVKSGKTNLDRLVRTL